jgi:hypothetical protein
MTQAFAVILRPGVRLISRFPIDVDEGRSRVEARVNTLGRGY